ncbi:MAG TPA: nuclear transport factor 2 family protein [Mucilaginibacter sp.]|jgi:hypothetical protein
MKIKFIPLLIVVIYALPALCERSVGNETDKDVKRSKLSLVINKRDIISTDTSVKETPVALVDRQLKAYNERNIDAFVEPYADDIEFYYYPDKLLGKGKDNLRKQYSSIFEKVPNLHSDVTQRIIHGNIVIDRNSVTGFGKDKIDGVIIYEIENNKIKRVRIMQ